MNHHAGMAKWSVAFVCGFLSCSTQAEEGGARVLMAQQQFEEWRFVTLLEDKEVHSLVAFNMAAPDQGAHTLWLIPNDDLSSWGAMTWRDTESSLIVTAIKQAIGIPCSMDHLWPVYPADGTGSPVGRPGHRPQIYVDLNPVQIRNEFPELNPQWQAVQALSLETTCGYHEVLEAMTLESRYVSSVLPDDAALVIEDSRALEFCQDTLIGEPPALEIVSLGDEVITSHRGEQYYLADDDVKFTAVASDLEDGALPVELHLNGLPYFPGEPISDPGDYMLKATTIDADGNSSFAFKRFSVQSYYTASSDVAIIEAEEYVGERDMPLLKLTAMIRLDQFDVRDIDVCTIRLVASGTQEGGSEHHVDGAWDEAGYLQTPGNADAAIFGQYLVCVFSGVPASAELDELQILGSGIGFPYSFLFWERSPVVYGVEDPRMVNPLEPVSLDVSEPECGVAKRLEEDTGGSDVYSDFGYHEYSSEWCFASWDIHHETRNSELVKAHAAVDHVGYMGEPLVVQSQLGHGANYIWKTVHCRPGDSECLKRWKMDAKPEFTLKCSVDVSWYHLGGFAAARSAGVLEVKLIGGISETSVLLNQSLALHRSGQNFVGGTLTPSGPGVTVTFTPREISNETVHCQAAPLFDSVRATAPTVMVRCWSHIKAAAYTNCWSRIADHWGPRGEADVLGWDPNYTMTIDHEAEECSGLPEIRRF